MHKSWNLCALRLFFRASEGTPCVTGGRPVGRGCDGWDGFDGFDG